MAIGGPNEADTCRDFVVPAVLASGWNPTQIREQHAVKADSPTALGATRIGRRADYVLELVPDLPLIVIEAKRLWAKPGDGIQQAMHYAKKLDVPFALSTNGTSWVLHNRVTGLQSAVDGIPTPEETWDMYCTSRGLTDEAQNYLRGTFDQTLRNPDGSVKALRYYQRRAIHEVLVAKAAGVTRILVVMATGAGKTFTALQLAWKLTNYRRLQQKSAPGLRNYRVLYLADRDILVKDPMLKHFRPVFREAVTRVRTRNTKYSPDIYFATYQVLSTNAPDNEPDSGETSALLAAYPSDFFDLVIIDECHRGSAREESTWRRILDHFSPAVQLGLTATPVNRNGADTYAYFGNPVFTYSLKEGIADGFLAPYTIRRVVFDVDAAGLEVLEGQLDVRGQEIPAGTYGTRDYERRLRLPDRTRAMAHRILDVLGDSRDRAVVFCVDSAHALTMCQALRNGRPERTRTEPEWVSRIMHDERDKDRLLEEFTDPERDIPQIAVTSSLLSTGVDIEDLKYVVICRPIGSISEFKQIVGRGTRLYPDKGKYEFEIIDFVGATSLFRDPEFDGPPLRPPAVDHVDAAGDPKSTTDTGSDEYTAEEDDSGRTAQTTNHEPEPEYTLGGSSQEASDDNRRHEKFELEGVLITLSSEGFYVHDVDSGQPRLVRYLDWVRGVILDRFVAPNELLAAWANPTGRENVVDLLRSRHVDSARLTEELGTSTGAPVDTVDQLLHLAFGLPTLTRAERVRRARSQRQNELAAYPAQARAILETLLDRYADHGIDEATSAAVVQVPPLSELGSPTEIAMAFGGSAQWHQARGQIQDWLYTA
ncbi:EcoAI/FtnUII family type I restriction enzme subunit R [Rhodococcus sp. NPDC057529]|uniref:EcoAI/FtnUII family type I restriction enzme subunit R n=1 Tax=Rhodococcus sp. NPDC057529 TaxID=3346158 RepID=UPI00366F2940